MNARQLYLARLRNGALAQRDRSGSFFHSAFGAAAPGS